MQKRMEYNSHVLQSLARRLRRRAVFVMALWPIMGILAGAYIGFENTGNVTEVTGAAVGAFVGYLVGSMRSLYYNVQSMNALCLKQIEENTRIR